MSLLQIRNLTVEFAVEFSQRGDRRHAILLEREAIGGANSGHVDE